MNKILPNTRYALPKNSTLDSAKAINSLVQKQFPFPSSWKKSNVEYIKLLEKSGYFSKDLQENEINILNQKIKKLNKQAEILNEKLIQCRKNYTAFVNNPVEYFKQLVLNVTQLKTMNCGEISRIIYLLLRLNFVNDTKINIVKPAINSINQKQKVLEHCAVELNNGNENIIIDGLLNEVDTKENICDIYRKKYKHTFKIPQFSSLKFLIAGSKTNPERNIPRISDSDAEELRKIFPQFILPKVF